MALIVTGNELPRYGVEYHIPFDTARLSEYAASVEMLCVQADGHELAEILAQFPHLSITLNVRKSMVVRFYGDTARYIIGNLR